MNNTLHTPGHWKILERKEHSFPDARTLTHISNGPHIVCTLGTTQTDGSPCHKYNARIIASAPEMLEALQGIVEAFRDQDSLLIDQAKAAIAKAKGVLP